MDRVIRVIKRNIHRVLFHSLYKNNKVILYGVPKYINAKNIAFGQNVRINDNVFFHASNKIKIGNNVTFSHGVTILTESYNVDDYKAYCKKEHKSKPVTIGNNVWLGVNAIVLPGIKIADNIIVGAGSIVTHDLTEEYTIYAGNPAKKIRKFGDKE